MIEHMLDLVYLTLTALLSLNVLSGQIFAGSPSPHSWLILFLCSGGLLGSVQTLMDLHIAFATLNHCIARSLLWSHLSAKRVGGFDNTL